MSNRTFLGKVGMTPKGEWNSSTAYKRLDIVSYEGSSYIAILDNTNSVPTDSNPNWMIGAKHGEFTEEQLEEFKEEVVAESKQEMDEYTQDKKDELDTYTTGKKTELDEYTTTKKGEIDTHTTQKINDYNSNATSKTNTFNQNAETKTTNFNDNATSKQDTFNQNAVDKTTAFNTNATQKTTDFNTNATNKTTDFNTNAESKTDDFDDNAAEKLEAFNDNAEEKTTEFDEHAEEMQAEINELKQDLADARKSQKTTTETGENITLDKTADMKLVKLDVCGNREQETRSGKNVLNINATPASQNISSATVDGSKLTLVKGTSNSYTRYVIPVTLEANTDYIFTGKVAFPNDESSGSSQIGIRTSATGGTWVLQKSLLRTSSEQTVNEPFNSGENTLVYFWFYLDAGNDGSTARTGVYTDFMIRKASITDDTYEEYGAMPSPADPSEVESVGDDGNANVTISNKNLAYDNWEQDFIDRVDHASWASKVTFDNRNCVDFYTNTTTGDTTIFQTKFKENKQYTFSFDMYCTIDRLNCTIEYTDGTSMPAGSATANVWFTKKFVSAVNKTVKRLKIVQSKTGRNYIDLDTFMVYEGTEDIDYIAHQEQAYNIPCQRPMSTGDYFDWDNRKEAHKRKQIVFDGTEDWTFSSAYSSVLINIVNRNMKTGANANIISNRFTVNPNKSQEGINVISSTYLYVKIDGLTTLEEYKAQFAEWATGDNPFMIEGDVIEEERLPFTQEQIEVAEQIEKARSYYEQTNIYSNNNPSPIIDVEAVQDMNLVIDSLDARLSLVEG